jgi:hypothetical protein
MDLIYFVCILKYKMLLCYVAPRCCELKFYVQSTRTFLSSKFFCCTTYCLFCVVIYIFCVVLCIVCFVSFYILFVRECVLCYCHRVSAQLQLTNISFFRTIILTVVLCGVKIGRSHWGCSSIGRNEVKRKWRRLHNEKLNDLYSSPNIVRVIESRRMRWAGHRARLGGGEGRCKQGFGGESWGTETTWKIQA